MSTLAPEDDGELSSPSRKSLAAQSTAAEPPTLPITRSRLIRAMDSSHHDDTPKELLEVHHGGRRLIDDMLLGVSGNTHNREGTPKGTKRQREEEMRVELEQIHIEAKEERKRKRVLRSSNVPATHNGEAPSSASANITTRRLEKDSDGPNRALGQDASEK